MGMSVKGNSWPNTRATPFSLPESHLYFFIRQGVKDVKCQETDISQKGSFSILFLLFLQEFFKINNPIIFALIFFSSFPLLKFFLLFPKSKQ